MGEYPALSEEEIIMISVQRLDREPIEPILPFPFCWIQRLLA